MEGSVPAAVAGSTFIRDRPTRLSYGVLGAYAFWLFGFGPAVALLRADIGFPYTLIGIYSAAWAGGSVIAGAAFAWAVAKLGLRPMLWSSVLATIGGAALFVFTRSVAWTLVGTLIMGCAGTLLQTTIQSILSALHGPRRDKALVEANLGAAACSVAAPIALGFFHSTVVTWRAAMVLPVIALTGLYILYARQQLPAADEVASDTNARTPDRHLPLASWLLCLLVAIGIGVEFCVLYFGSHIVAVNTGLSTAAAATAMTWVYVGILVGRAGGAVLTRRPGRTHRLLWASLALTLAGLCIIWLSPDPNLAVCGLFLTGIGIGNQFPLALAAALGAAPRRTDTANARAQFLGALLLLIAPFLLGSLADHVGLLPAFSIAPVLMVLGTVLFGLAARLEKQAPTGAAGSGQCRQTPGS